MREGFVFRPLKVAEDVNPEESYKGSVLECDRIHPHVIEGAEILDTLCPISKNTGRRENPLSLLGKLTGANSQLLNSVLQELPVLRSDPRLTDEDRVNAIVDRLSTGTPAEDALMAERLMRDIDALGISAKPADDVKPSDTIEFRSTDVEVNPE